MQVSKWTSWRSYRMNNITTGEVLVGLTAITVVAIAIVVKVLRNGTR